MVHCGAGGRIGRRWGRAVSNSILPLSGFGAANHDRADATARRFLIGIFVASVVPVALFAALPEASATDASAGWAVRAIVVLSTGHVGLSALFWLDRRYRAHIAAQTRTYYWDFFLLAGLCLIGLHLPALPFMGALVLGYLVWNGYHYARQNWGILCLTALGTREARPTRTEYYGCMLGCAGGVLGMIPASMPNLLPASASTLGFATTLLALAVALWVALRQFLDRADPLRIAMTLVNGMFFLPIFVFGPVIGFVTIATIHAGHYYFLMIGLAADRRQGPAWLRVGGALACAAVLAAGVELIRNPEFSAGLLNADQADTLIIIVLMWHYILDGGLWRLRQRFQRATVAESLPFLFAVPARADQE